MSARWVRWLAAVALLLTLAPRAHADAALPDLVVDLTWTPAEPGVGEAVSFTYTIRNVGTAAVDAPFHVTATYDGLAPVIDEDITSVPIAPGDARTGNLQATPPGGAHTIHVTVDSKGAIAEMYENNNQVERTMTVAGPDLVVTNVSWEPASPKPGNLVAFHMTVKNVGTRTVTSVHNASWAWNGASPWMGAPDEIGTLPVALGPGASYIHTFTRSMGRTPGHFTFSAFADANGSIAETDESNNGASGSLDIVGSNDPLPDLVIARVFADPEFPRPFENTTFHLVVKNEGEGIADVPFSAKWEWDRAPIWRGPMSVAFLFDAGLAPGEEQERTVVYEGQDWRSTPMDYVATVDVDHIVEESDETNDVVQGQMVGGYPDLTPVRVWLDDSTWNTSTQIHVAVQNAGNAPVARPWRMFWSLNESDDWDPTLSSMFGGEIAVGEEVQYTATIRTPTRGGPVEYGVDLDVLHNIFEIDNKNNHLSGTLFINKPSQLPSTQVAGALLALVAVALVRSRRER